MFLVPIVVKKSRSAVHTVYTSNQVPLTSVLSFSLFLVVGKKNVNTISTDLCMCETEPDLTIPANRRLAFEASSSSSSS